MLDTLGDRIKELEGVETSARFMPQLPVIARMDGRSFSNFTRGMTKPYDTDMVKAMVETTKYLVEETNACIGYTQSDEITLIFFSKDEKSQIFFDGRKFKMTSMLASLTSTKFLLMAQSIWPDRVNKTIPVFDARLFQVPSKEVAVDALGWRVADAVKNSITSAANCYYSHNELMNKNGKEKQEMLFQKGINWNDYPRFFKEGTFIQRRKVLRNLTEEEMARIPEKFRPEGPIERSDVKILDMPQFSKIINKPDVVFDGADPMMKDSV